MTNAEKIRAMNDEQLAEWIADILGKGFEWFDARSCNLCQAENAGRCPHPEDYGCKRIGEEILDWLKSE